MAVAIADMGSGRVDPERLRDLRFKSFPPPTNVAVFSPQPASLHPAPSLLLFPLGLAALAMKSFSSLLAAALFVVGVSAQLTVNTPANVVECAPLTVTWSGGTAPYFLSVHSGNDVNGAPLISFDSTTSTSLTWPAVNFTSGTSLDLSLRDSAGASSQSAVFTVQAGTTGCLTGASSAAGSSTPAASSSGSAASSSSASSASTPLTSATTPATTPGSSSSTSRASSSSTSSRPASSTSSNAAMATGVTYGVAGVLGAAVAAIFV